MSREERWRVRVKDILDAEGRIQTYTVGKTAEGFFGDQKTIDAVVRNIEVIGEAARHVPAEIEAAAPEVPFDQEHSARLEALAARTHV